MRACLAVLLAAIGLLGQGAAYATVALSGQFVPNEIFQGERSRLTITIQNDQAAVLNNAAFTNNLPTQLRFYTGVGAVAPSTTCTAGTVSGSAGTGPGGEDQVLFTGGQIPAAPLNGQVTCQISIDVTSTTSIGAGNNITYNDSLDPTLYRDDINASAAPGVITASILVKGLAAPTVAKVFGTSPLPQGNTSTVTITLSNSNTGVNMPLTTFVDNLPSNLNVLGVPAPANTCGGTVANTASSVTLTGGTIPTSGSCTVTFSVIGVLPALTTTQAGTNSFAAGAVGNTRGLSSPVASTGITVNSPMRLEKGFSPSPLSVGNTSTMTFRIRNDSGAALTNVSLDDTVAAGRWPSQVSINGAASTFTGCGGTLTPAGAGAGFTLSGATIAAGGTCTIAFPVTSNTVSVGGTDWTNTIPAGAVGSNEGFYSPAVSARLDVRNDALTIAKTVSPTSVTPGDIVTFAVNVTTFSPSAQTGVSFTDTLPGSMLFVDNSVTGGIAPTLTGGCTSLVRAGTTAAPQFTFNMPASDADGVICTVTFTARVPANATPGVTTFINSTGPVGNGAGGVSGTSAASGTLSVLQPFTVSKVFDGVAARSLPQGSASQVEIILSNNNFSALSSVAFTDTLPTTPGQLRIANPANATSTCGGTLTANPGDTTIVLAGGNIPGRATTTPFAAGTCAIRVNVVGGSVGAPTPHTNTIPVGSVTALGEINGVANTTVSNTNAASATLQYTAALEAVKSFITNPVTAGGTSRVRIVLRNVGAGVLTNVGVIDPLGADLQLAAVPNASSTCNGALTITAPAGGNTATLTGATLPAGSVATPATCEFLFDVVAPGAGAAVNTIPVGNITADGGVSNSTAVTATLNKTNSTVLLTKSFTPTTISSPGQVSQLRINMTNGAGVALSDLGIVDTLPAGMLVAAVPNASTNCPGGIANASAGAGSVSLTNGTLAVGASCQVFVDVTTLSVGTLTNTLPVNIITNTQGVSNTQPFSANLSALAALGIAKNFTPPSVPPNTRARLTLTLNNTLAIALNSISGTDNLPAGLQTAVPPNTSTTCAGATVNTTAGSITFSGASLPANNGSCRIDIDVIAPAVGAYDNFIPGGSIVANGGNVTNPPPGTHAILNVLNPPTVAKAFTAAVVSPGQANRLTVTITNPNAGQALTNVSLRDTLPTGLFVAPTPNASTTCAGGSVSAVPSATSAQVAGGTIPAAGSCTFQFDTVSNIAGLYTNTIAASSVGTAEGVTNVDPASAQMRVLVPPTLTKTFTPPSIAPGGTSRLVITLGNQNAAAQTLAQNLDDTLPLNVVIAATPNIGGTCTVASVTAAAGGTLVRYASGATLPAGGCTIQVDVTSATAGTYNNNIPASALRTDVGSNISPATAPLVVSPLGAISGLIYRDDNNDGLYQASEQPFAGQTVQLLDSTNAVVATTTTDAGGNYLFAGLAAGTYSVRQPNQPASTLSGKTSVGTVGGVTTGTATAPNVVPSIVSGIVLGLSGGNVSSSINNNFGEIVASDISGTVYRDDNNNGVINGTEPRLAGVPITLSGVDDLGTTVLLNTTTAADGTYSFNGLRPSAAGGYTVTEGTQPTNTGNGITSAGTVRDKTLNGNVGTPGTGSNTAPAAPPAPVGTSRIASIVLPPNATSQNNNFGELASNRTLSGRIFTDNNADGTVNGSDAGVGTGATGVNNVAQTLTLTGTDTGGNPVNMTTTTDATGNYSFLNVPPGTAYSVTCTTCTPPAGFVNSPGPLSYPGSTGGAAAGTQAVPAITGINLDGANTISASNNFTKVPPGQQITGRVYFDVADNGSFDSSVDLPLANQTIELRDNATNALVATTTSNASGFYAFNNVAAGTYKIVQPTQPAGTNDGKTHAGTVNGIGGVNAGAATAQGTTPSTISGVVIAAGQSGANYDFPEIATVTLGGRVWDDANLDNTFNAGDTALQGVVMQLTGTDNFGNVVSRFVGTDTNGQYSFTGLLPGTYTVTENQPASYTSSVNSIGTVTNGTAGTVGALGGTQETMSVTLNGPTSSAPNLNFTERLIGSTIRGFKSVANQSRPGLQPASGDILVWTISYRNESGGTLPLQIEDVLPAGLTRTGAPAITVTSSGVVAGLTANGGYTGIGAGATVQLLLGGAQFGNGAVVTVNLPTVVTVSSGTLSNQAFANAARVPTSQTDTATIPSLPAGVNVPAGSLPQVAPTNANANNLVPTVVSLSRQPAAVSGTVWLDNDSDRRRGAGDTLLAGWGVAVYDASGNLVPCTNGTPSNTTTSCVQLGGKSLFQTDASGNYGVKDLNPGSYKIEFHDPKNNITFATPMNSGNDPNSSVSNNRDHLSINLAAGANMVQQDLPIDPSGVVYDSSTRAPIPNAKVQMCGPAGFNPSTMLIGGAAYAIAGNCATMTTDVTGLYQFLLTSTAPAGTYSLNVTAPSYAPAPSTLITPAPGPYTPAGASPVRVQAQAGPPTGGQPTTYYMSFSLGPGTPDLIHNHIPLDPFTGTGLFLQKSVDRDTVEIGDSVQYTLRVVSPAGAATNVHIVDNMPAGFRLIPGTVIQDGVRRPDPSGSPGPTLDFNVGNLGVGTPVVITYRVRVAVGSQQGDGINRARAHADGGANSNEARARVKITSGVFFEESCVVGKIFVDCNNNRIQDPEELGIPGVRFYLHDGTYLISDVEGKYSYCGLPARTGVIKADSTTLPLGSQLVTSSNRNALDANSLFLDLQKGELHRADFIEGSCGPNVLEQVKARRAKGSVAAPIVEKKPQPKLIFESGGSIRKSIPKERDDVMRSCTGGQCNAPAGNSITPANGVTGGAK